MSIPAAASVVVIFLFLSALAITLIALKKLTLETSQKRLLVNAILISVAAKIVIAMLGSNWDVNSYCIVSNILEQGKSVYANTDRYNYGPIWAWLVAGLGRLAPCGAGEGFHALVAAFLAAVDVMIGIIVARAYSWIAAMVFLLSPISFFISGYHSQFDNLAVLLSLLAWVVIRAGEPKLPHLFGSSALLGVSLAVKHIMFLFPAWLLFWKPLGKLRYRVLYAGLAYSIFGASFLPWWSDPPSRAGILRNVFSYRSVYGDSLWGRLIGLFTPLDSFDAFFLRWLHVHSGLQMLWMGLMLAAGIVLATKDKRELFLFYLMALYASSPSVASQYMAIPMVAGAVYCGLWESWAFIGAGTGALLLSRANIVCPLVCHMALTTIGKGNSQHVAPLVNWLDAYPGHMLSDSSQLCMAALLVNRWRDGDVPHPILQRRTKLLRALALILAGLLPMMLAQI
jgi:hypothetical protein